MNRLDWYCDDTEAEGLFGCVTVAKVKKLEAGEAEGGLGALVRFMAGATGSHKPLPPLSPAGWWWTGTPEQRGRWIKRGPFQSQAEAVADCTRAFDAGNYFKVEG
jgi:hypothetical protein